MSQVLGDPSDDPSDDRTDGPTADPTADLGADLTGQALRDIADVPAIEVITTTALHLMSAAAVKCGLGADEADARHQDLDEARKLISALAGLVTAAGPEVGSQHAALLRDGLKQLQLAFREASPVPDTPGQGPGEKLTGSVV
jgi:hypothetical protein